jgi:hypothetical protein
MKKVALVVVFALAALVAYNFVTTGEIRLIPAFSQSEDERAVAALEDRFEHAKKQFAGAHRSAAVSGLDTTSDVEGARIAAKRIEKELRALRKRLTDERALDKADRLLEAVRAFNTQLR